MRCRIEGCELGHCRRCDRHFCPEIGGGVCDACLIDQASAETAAVTRAFGGNSEAAAQAMGW
jgi:hypothetical protein